MSLTPIPKSGEILNFLVRSFAHIDDQNMAAMKKRLHRAKRGEFLPADEVIRFMEEWLGPLLKHPGIDGTLGEDLRYHWETYLMAVRELNCFDLPPDTVRRELACAATKIFRSYLQRTLRPFGLTAVDVMGKPEKATAFVWVGFIRGRSISEIAVELDAVSGLAAGEENWCDRLKNWRNGGGMRVSTILRFIESGYTQLGYALLFANAYRRYCDFELVEAPLHPRQSPAGLEDVQKALGGLAEGQFSSRHQFSTEFTTSLLALNELVRPSRPKEAGDFQKAEKEIAFIKNYPEEEDRSRELYRYFALHNAQAGDLSQARDDLENACERLLCRDGPILRIALSQLLIIANVLKDKRCIARWSKCCAAMEIDVVISDPRAAFDKMFPNAYPENSQVM